jgi:hypothetical protein
VTRHALAAALLAALSGTSPSAADGNKVTYTCGTAPETVKRADGKVNTWNLSAFSFTPDNRSTRPLLIRYRSITRLEFGHTPPHPVETRDTAPITLPCALKPERKDYYLTIFYKEEVPDDDEKKATSESKEQRDKKTQARQDRRDRLERWDSKNRTDPKDDRNQKTSTNRRAQRDQKNASDRRDQRDGTDRKDEKAENDRKDESDRNDLKDESGAKKEKEYFAVFELGDGVLRPALRILETRSGKRVNFQDANARKAAR